MDQQIETATFGGGCFWCTEAVFLKIKGVKTVVSGYTAGAIENPTYEQVSSGTTGHAEAIQISFDPHIVSYSDLLEIFWATHDPTTLNKQGYDVGTQYRSVIVYHSDEQLKLAQASKIQNQKDFINPIVTEIVPFSHFYSAEQYHQRFYEQNPQSMYCNLIIAPKIEKLIKKFSDKVI